MSSVEVTLNTPLAEALNAVIQPKLVEVGWSTGGVDDSALSEYIILMLVNGKTQDQIAAELSGDLLNLGPDDPGAIDFSRWLFEQVEVLHRQQSGGSLTQPPAVSGGEVPEQSFGPAQVEQGGDLDEVGGSPTVAQDTEMGDSAETAAENNIPTGPKSMRNGNRNNKRLLGNLSKAMDRSSDAVLHRVRPQQGTERINSHSREPPKGPRNLQNRNPRIPPNNRNMGGMQAGGMQNGGQVGNAMMNMTPQQQMQLFAMYEEQARMMSQILSPQQQQQMFVPPGMGGPLPNSGYGNGFQPQGQAQQPGRSLFERAEKRNPRQNTTFKNRQQQNGGKPPARTVQDHVMDTDAVNISASNPTDPSSSMEVEASQQNTATTSPEETTCKFNLACTNQTCPYAHQSPAAPPGTSIDVHDSCPFGAACKNKKCVARHPSPAVKSTHQAEQDCKFFPNCTNPTCPFRHPSMPLCRNGADCTRENCKFTHVKTVCKYNPCLNPLCPFKHAEGQKRGAFRDKVWTAEGGVDGDAEGAGAVGGFKGKAGHHVSERKFVSEDNGDEELIIPTSNSGPASSTSAGTELVT
ncbi:MAG: hypothetical protein M1833_003484 [Piccolia ochrophora]|nr:MAG: hypothetical protein M1833_003484 [Piccolia ochrophora]